MLSVIDRQRLPRRTWTPWEREIVRRGFSGRAAIGIEPIAGCAVFSAVLSDA
jgi:hypothetical protein